MGLMSSARIVARGVASPSKPVLLTAKRPLNRRLAISHVNIVPMDFERVLPDHTVVIEDGHIQAMGPASEFEGIHPDVDGRGKWLMPGLADMHVHFWDPGQAALFLANGVTQVRNLTGAPMHLAMQRKMEHRELIGPHVITSTPLIDGLNADGNTAWPGSLAITDASQAAELVRALWERGYQQLKVYQLLAADAHRALSTAALALGMRVTGHCPDGMTFEQAIAHGQTCFEHLTNITVGHLNNGLETPQLRRMGTQATFEQRLLGAQLFLNEVNFDALRRLADQFAEQQIWNCPTSTVWTLPAQDVDVALREPSLRYMHPHTVAEWRSRLQPPADPQRARQREQLMDLQRAGNEIRFRIARLLLDASAPLRLGTDTANPFVIPGFSLHEELMNLVRAGFTPFQALRCGTSEAARFMHQSHVWGTVSVGKRADLLLLAAGQNPLDNVSAVASPEAVFVNDFYLTREDLDQLLAERADSVIARVEPPTLEPLAGGGVVHEGVLQNSFAGRVNGFIAFRVRQLPAGGWLLEEHRTGGPGEALRQMWLGADFTVERIEDRYPTPVGESRYAVGWDDDRSTYQLDFQSIDGLTRRRTIGDRRLPPAWGVGLIVLPHLITDVESETTFQALGTAFAARGPDDFAVVDMHVTPQAGQTWLVRIGAPTPSERAYSFDAAGRFLHMEEMLNGSPRRVEPLPPS
jgi:imidazolonepropionase-like amidohydrolase